MALSSINSGSFQPSSSSLAPKQEQVRQQVKSSTPVPATATPSIEDKRQSAMQLVTRTLAAAYEKIAGKDAVATTAFNDQEPMTANRAASTILGFIERRLKMDVADGATQEQLQSRLEAGLEGFKKGFAEAEEKLRALSMFYPEVEADLADTYKQVMDGIDALRSKFITDATSAAPETLSKTTTPAIKAPSAINNIAIQQGLYEYAEARDFMFELTTKEGDKVTIRASSSVGASTSAVQDKNGISVNGSKSSASNFDLSVEGNLNEDELNAINELLGRVDKLAGQFYAGNLDDVFDKAVSLGFDDQQIAGYSLNLSQVQIQQVVEAYGAVAQNGDSQSTNLANQLAPVGDFIKDVLSTLNIADEFVDPHKLLLDLTRKMADQAESKNEEPSALSKFLERILALDLPQKTDEVVVS